jgi:hypothetical protein
MDILEESVYTTLVVSQHLIFFLPIFFFLAMPCRRPPPTAGSSV